MKTLCGRRYDTHPVYWILFSLLGNDSTTELPEYVRRSPTDLWRQYSPTIQTCILILRVDWKANTLYKTGQRAGHPQLPVAALVDFLCLKHSRIDTSGSHAGPTFSDTGYNGDPTDVPCLRLLASHMSAVKRLWRLYPALVLLPHSVHGTAMFSYHYAQNSISAGTLHRPDTLLAVLSSNKYNRAIVSSFLVRCTCFALV